jgi:hypothetical protein
MAGTKTAKRGGARKNKTGTPDNMGGAPTTAAKGKTKGKGRGRKTSAGS